jgi:hypothetical protein
MESLIAAAARALEGGLDQSAAADEEGCVVAAVGGDVRRHEARAVSR